MFQSFQFLWWKKVLPITFSSSGWYTYTIKFSKNNFDFMVKQKKNDLIHRNKKNDWIIQYILIFVSEKNYILTYVRFLEGPFRVHSFNTLFLFYTYFWYRTLERCRIPNLYTIASKVYGWSFYRFTCHVHIKHSIFLSIIVNRNYFIQWLPLFSKYTIYVLWA